MATGDPAPPRRVYPTYGVHNPPCHSPCASHDCLYQRGPGDPSDPLFPEYWSARWTMYRVFRRYENYPPPYDGPPPPPLQEGVDYQVSYGATYYDSTWRGPNGEEGAMMEHFEEWCLPIFPRSNHFTASFISLGETAYCLTYDQDRPAGMPPVCLFSDLNHPPRRDFIKHLPYSAGDSDRLGGQVQGYSFWTNPDPSRPPIQVGASPDRTADRAILFGYAFRSAWEPDAADPTVPPYRHPHSFYFSGYTPDPPNAPIVTQNYTDFAMIRPDPAKTWDLVAQHAAGQPIPTCNLFGSRRLGLVHGAEPPTWAGDQLP